MSDIYVYVNCIYKAYKVRHDVVIKMFVESRQCNTKTQIKFEFESGKKEKYKAISYFTALYILKRQGLVGYQYTHALPGYVFQNTHTQTCETFFVLI